MKKLLLSLTLILCMAFAFATEFKVVVKERMAWSCWGGATTGGLTVVNSDGSFESYLWAAKGPVEGHYKQLKGIEVLNNADELLQRYYKLGYKLANYIEDRGGAMYERTYTLTMQI